MATKVSMTTPKGGQITVTKSELRNDEGDPFKVHLEKLVEKNKPYFNHLGGNCVCGKCICGRCKCPKNNLVVDYKRGAGSEYQNNYKQQMCHDCQPLLKGNFFDSYYNNQPMDLVSTHRHDYTTPPLNQTQGQLKPKDTANYLPFDGHSGYRATYLNWGSNPSSTLKPPFHPTVIKDLPFISRTMYRDCYQGKPSDRNPHEEQLLNNSRFGTFKSPLSPDFPFIGESTTNATYKPFKTRKGGESMGPQKRNYDVPGYDGQYLTTKDKDYDAKGVRKCPAREILNKMAKEGVISWTSRSHF